MTKNLPDFLPYYLGQKFILTDEDGNKRIQLLTTYNLNYYRGYYDSIQLILRPLSDMTEEEAEHFAWMCMDSRHHLGEDSRIRKDELDVDLVKNDNATMLDGDIEIYISVSARCLMRNIIIKKDGSIYMGEEEDEGFREPIEDIAFKIHYLLSRGFDLFGLIERGDAVDANTLKQTI
jgi:hypothetical protein